MVVNTSELGEFLKLCGRNHGVSVLNGTFYKSYLVYVVIFVSGIMFVIFEKVCLVL